MRAIEGQFWVAVTRCFGHEKGEPSGLVRVDTFFGTLFDPIATLERGIYWLRAACCGWSCQTGTASGG